MKNRFFYNALKVFGITAALFAVFSCKNVSEPEDQTPLLKITMVEKERTIFPDALEDLTLLSDIQLWGCEFGQSSQLLASFDNVDDLEEAAIALPFENSEDVLGHTWIFELAAKKGNLNYAAACSKEIVKGINTLNFELVLQNLGSENGSGSIKFTIDYSQAYNADKVTKVRVSIWEWVNNGYATTNPTSFTLTDDDNDGIILLEADDFAPGSYQAYFYFYHKDAIILQWPENLQVAEGLVSSEEIKIEKFNDVINVNYELNKGTDDTIQLPGDAVTAISRFNKADAEVPVPTSSQSLFLGWFTDSALTNAFNNNFAAAYEAGKDLTLYAKWQLLEKNDDGVYEVSSDLAEQAVQVLDTGTAADPVVIKVTGELTSSELYNLARKISDTGGYYGLDLSSVEGIAVLPGSCFMDNNALISIVLPEGLKTIQVAAFRYARNLSSVNIPSTVESIQSQAFLGCKFEEIIIPDSVITINPGAFSDCDNLRKVTIGKGVKYEGSVFNGSPLEEIVLSSENTNFIQTSDGVVYSADGKRLYAFPYGTYTGIYEVPEELEGIGYNELYAANKLSGIKFPDDGSTWYYGSYQFLPSTVDGIISLMQKETALANKTTSDYSFNLYSYAKNEFGNHIIKITAEQKEEALEQYFAPIVTLQVYDKESLNVTDGSFTSIYGSSVSDFLYYKIPTEAGQTYYVSWVDGNSLGYTNKGDDFTDCQFCLYDGNIRPLIDNDSHTIDDTNSYSFTATTSETFIGVAPLSSGNACVCAFRVYQKIPVPSSIKISVAPTSDIQVEQNVQTDGIYFYVPSDEYSSYVWYVNGRVDNAYTNCSYFYYYPNDYTDKVNTITLEAKKNDVWYSYSASIEKE